MAVTTWMGMTLPVPSVTLGPLWAQQSVAAYRVIDGHSHIPATGGRPLPSAALVMDADLPFNEFNATNLRSVRFTSQASTLVDAADLNCAYFTGGNYFINNGSGTPVQITDGNTLAATSFGGISGLSGTTGSASFSTFNNGFTWLQDSNLPATMQQGPTTIYDVSSPSGNGVTLYAPVAQAVPYNLTFPVTIPNAAKLISVVSGGQLGYSDVDGTSLQYSTQTLSIKDSGVTSAKIADNAVTTAKVFDGAITQAKLSRPALSRSSSCGTFTTSSTSEVQVTNWSITKVIVGSGPVMIMAVPDGGSLNSGFEVNAPIEQPASTPYWNPVASLRIKAAFNGGAEENVGFFTIQEYFEVDTQYTGDGTLYRTPSAVSMMWQPAHGAGSYVVKVYARIYSNTNSIRVVNSCLSLYEL